MLIGAGVAIALLIAAQLVIPAISAHVVESRLTEGGGSADVSVSALPAERLLFGHGSEIDVSGSRLALEVSTDGGTFDKLDGFDRVHVAIDDSTVGPFSVHSFRLDRDGSDAAYHLDSSSSATGAGLLAFGASELGVPFAGLLGAAAGQLSDASEPIPIEMNMELTSEDGAIKVVSGGGTIAGYPTGPLAELLTAAIAVRL